LLCLAKVILVPNHKSFTINLHRPQSLHFKGPEPDLRVRIRAKSSVASSVPDSKEARFKVIDPIAVLKAGLRTVRHHQFGWLAEDLKACGELDGTKESLNTRLWSDYNAQLVHMRAMRDILGEDYDPLHVLAGRNNEGKFIVNKNVDVPKNHLSLTYLLHAYGVSQSTFKRLRQRGGETAPVQVPHNKGKSVVTDKDYASTVYTPRYFFVNSQMKKWVLNNPEATSKRKANRRKWLRKQWDMEKEKDPKFGPAYEKRSRDHSERHHGAKNDLVELLNRNGRRSYTSLGKALNNWCSASTIERFLKSNPDYLTYSQNVRPLLSEGNRLKQVAFSKHVQDRWGLGAGKKILWTMR
jgi:hypothetical protein